MAPTIVLVHGTWGRGLIPFRKVDRAAWTTKSALVDSLDTPPDRHAYVSWSGSNSFRARRIATERIKDLVGRLPASSRAVLIAHSHGGAAAVLSLRDPVVAARVAGVVCLATPFIALRPRYSATPASKRTDFIIAAMWSAPPIVLAWLAALAAGYIPVIPFFLLAPITTFGVPLLLPRLPWFRNVVNRRAATATASAAAFCERFTPAAGASVPILIARAPGDEASVALSVAYFVRLLSSATGPALFLAVVVVGASALLQLGGPADAGVVLNVLSTGLVAVVIGLWVIAPIVLLPFLAAWSFGFDYILLSPFVKASVEASVTGEATIFQARDASGRSHSLYDNPEVAKFVSEWVRRLR